MKTILKFSFKNSSLLLFLLISVFTVRAQDTVAIEKLNFENNVWQYNHLAFTGIARKYSSEYIEFYKYENGKQNGYVALYSNGDTAGVHIYSGNMIHLLFYTREKKKTLEYHQQILDQTYTVGEWIDYRDDGTIQVKGNYKLIQKSVEGRGGITRQYTSVKDGIWELYDENEKLIKREIWRNDKLIRTKNLN